MRVSPTDRAASLLGEDHPVVQALRQLANMIGAGGSSGGPSAVVVWRPAGPVEPGVYLTSTAAFAAAQLIPGKVTVQLDATVPAAFDATLHDCQGRIGLAAVVRESVLPVSMPEGCQVKNPAAFAGVQVVTQASIAPNIVFDLAVQAQFYMSAGATLFSLGGLASILQNKAMHYMLSDQAALGRSSIACNGFVPEITLLTRSQLQASAIDNGAASYTVNRDASASFSGLQGPASVTDNMIDLPTNEPFDGTMATPVKMATMATVFDAIEEANGPLEIRGYRALPLTLVGEDTVVSIGSNFEGGLFLLTRPTRCARIRTYIPMATPGAVLSFALYQNDTGELGSTNASLWSLIASGTSGPLPAGPAILSQVLTASGVAYQGTTTLTAGVYALVWGVDSGGPVNGQVHVNPPLELGNVDVPSSRAVLTFTTPYPANLPPPLTLNIHEGSADIVAVATPVAPVHILSAS